MTRQQRRNAERRLRKYQFPFPDLHKWLSVYLYNHPETFAQIRDDSIFTNLSGETQTLNVIEFRALLERLKAEPTEVSDECPMD